MGNPEPGLIDLCVSIEQEVEIERPRPLGRDGRPVPAEATFDGQEQIEELSRRALGVERCDPVQEPGLEVPGKGPIQTLLAGLD